MFIQTDKNLNLKKPFKGILLLVWLLCPLLAFLKYCKMYFLVIIIAVMEGFPPQVLLSVSVKLLSLFILLYGIKIQKLYLTNI
jgi:hypothetical protein